MVYSKEISNSIGAEYLLGGVVCTEKRKGIRIKVWPKWLVCKYKNHTQEAHKKHTRNTTWVKTTLMLAEAWINPDMIERANRFLKAALSCMQMNFNFAPTLL